MRPWVPASFAAALCACTGYQVDQAAYDARRCAEDPSQCPGAASAGANDGGGGSAKTGGAGGQGATPSTGGACPEEPAGLPATSCGMDPASCVVTEIFPAPSSSTRFPFGIAADATHVYWVSQTHYDGNEEGYVQRVTKTGEDYEAMTVTHVRPTELVLDGDYVYWVSMGFDASNPLATLARLPRTAECVPACDVDDIEVLSTGHGGESFQRLVVGGPETLFIGSNARILRVAREGTEWVTSSAVGDVYPTLAAAGGFAYWTANKLANVYRLPASGTLEKAPYADLGTPVTYTVLGATCTDALALSDQHLFLLSRSSSKPLELTQEALPAGMEVQSIAVDASFVYMAGWNAGGVFRMPRAGGPVSTIVGGNIWRLFVDDDAIYYGDHQNTESAGAIYRIDK
jgi:hypothetical protein